MGFATTVQQVGLMTIFILLGLFSARKGWLGPETSSGLTNILVYVVTPCVIVSAFNRPFASGQLRNLGVVALTDACAFLAMIGLVFAIYARVREPGTRRALRFGGIYPNAGYMGIPLVQALLGPDGVFFAVIFLAAFNVYAWTQGWSMFPARGSGGALKRLFTNPAVPSILFGLALFVSPVKLPRIVATGLADLSALNAPLSMFIIGASLAGIAWRTFATDPFVWVGTGVRNLLIPSLAVLALWAIPLPDEAKYATLILLSCPVAAFLVMFSIMHEVATDFATRLVCLSTLVSILTLPAILNLARALW